MTETNLEFVLNFTSPLDVSENQQPDRLKIEFLSNELISKTSNKPLQLDAIDAKVLDLDIPK
jgi:hypothetical protein